MPKNQKNKAGSTELNKKMDNIVSLKRQKFPRCQETLNCHLKQEFLFLMGESFEDLDKSNPISNFTSIVKEKYKDLFLYFLINAKEGDPVRVAAQANQEKIITQEEYEAVAFYHD